MGRYKPNVGKGDKMSSNPMDREFARLLAEGQAAARRGDRAMARTLLTQLVDQDPHNEEA